MRVGAFKQGCSGASRSGFGLAIGVLAAGVLAWTTGPASAITLLFQDVINTNDPTFNQELGINNTGMIAGYFGSGAAGHPNLGYTVVPPFGQANFTAENFPNSAQTQVTGLNNLNVPTTVGFFSNTNKVMGRTTTSDSQESPVPLSQSTIRTLRPRLRWLTNWSALTTKMSLSASTPMRGGYARLHLRHHERALLCQYRRPQCSQQHDGGSNQ